MNLRELIKDELSNSITDVDFIIELLEISKTYPTTLDKLITKISKQFVDIFTVNEDNISTKEIDNIVELKDYNLTNKKAVTEVVTANNKIELNKPTAHAVYLSPEKQLILLTVAWCKRPVPTSYICKQAQRLSFYFNLDKDPRWNEIDKWSKCKMRSDLIGALHTLKKQSYLEEKEDIKEHLNSNAKHYYLTSLGLETAKAISDAVSFNPFDTAI